MKQIFVHFEQIGKQVLGDIDNVSYLNFILDH